MASAQKCGGVQTKIISTKRSAFGSIELVTDVHPKSGGAAPAKPPITIFCGVALFRKTV